jgi:hypothetical protein
VCFGRQEFAGAIQNGNPIRPSVMAFASALILTLRAEGLDTLGLAVFEYAAAGMKDELLEQFTRHTDPIGGIARMFEEAAGLLRLAVLAGAFLTSPSRLPRLNARM